MNDWTPEMVEERLIEAASVLRRWQKAFSWQGWGLWLALRPPPPPPPPKSQS